MTSWTTHSTTETPATTEYDKIRSMVKRKKDKIISRLLLPLLLLQLKGVLDNYAQRLVSRVCTRYFFYEEKTNGMLQKWINKFFIRLVKYDDDDGDDGLYALLLLR